MASCYLSDPKEEMLLKCKVFGIHLTNESANDEANLNKFLEGITPKRIYTSFNGMSWSGLIFYEETADKAASNKAEDIVLSPGEQELYDMLRCWRNEQARSDELQPYIISNNLSLKHIAKNQVRTKDDLLQIKGFGEKRTEKYGNSILKVIESYNNERKIAN